MSGSISPCSSPVANRDASGTVTMAMTMEHSTNRHIGSMGFDHLPYGNGPQFTNPWAPANGQIFGTGIGSNNNGFDGIGKSQNARSTPPSLPYSSLPAASSMGASYQHSPYPQPDLVRMSQDLVNQNAHSYDHGYSAPPSSVGSFAPTSAPYVNSYGAVAHTPQHEEPRRLSQSWVSSCAFRRKC